MINLDIDSILTELAARTEKGIPDLKNEEHLNILKEILLGNNYSKEFVETFINEIKSPSSKKEIIKEESLPVIVRNPEITEDTKKENTLQIIYSLETPPNKITKSIFLAGPTPRNKDTKSWRPEALAYLKEINYDGVIFYPEYKDGPVDDKKLEYSEQIKWETKCMNIADIILFWIPRDLKDLPGFTTNDEYGTWKKSGKVVLGFPKNAEKVRYQEYFAKKLNIPIYNDLKECLKFISDKLDSGALRTDGEINIPLDIWNHKAFKNWYKELQTAGNRLDDAKIEYTYRIGKNKEILFFIILWAKVFITKENRYKENEIVFMRGDISSCVLYKINENNILDTDIVIVKEFRTPVSNKDGMVHEVPGGSSFKSIESATQVIIDELSEETGLKVDSNKLKFEQERQLQATSLSHKCFLFSYELTEEELNELKKNKDKVFGVVEDTERTYIEIYKLKDILTDNAVDWSNIGFILSVLLKKLKIK